MQLENSQLKLLLAMEQERWMKEALQSEELLRKLASENAAITALIRQQQTLASPTNALSAVSSSASPMTVLPPLTSIYGSSSSSTPFCMPVDKTAAVAPATPPKPIRSNPGGVTVSLSTDADFLSPYQVGIRQSLEYFAADAEAISTNVQGRKKQIHLGQVGVRCRWCAELPLALRGRGAVYYPVKLAGVYQAAQNMAGTHLLESCWKMPPEIREQLRRARLTQRRGSNIKGKDYWISSCQKIGLQETERGIWFQSPDATGESSKAPVEA